VIAAQRGYHAIVVVPDKTSAEKIALLRAYGAEVVVTASGVPREDPRHVSQVAGRLAEETPGAWFANQYDNPANPQAHRETTGPEIWRQTGGRITHFVAGVGTGGTITGAGGFLKQENAAVRIVGADPHQSVYAGGDGSPYYVESIGHYLHPETIDDLWPESYDPAVVDWFERIGDREALTTARRLAREEGLLVGGSAGAAVAAALRVARRLGPDDLVVALLPDSGRSYLSKYFDDQWLLQYGFVDANNVQTVRDVLDSVENDVLPVVFSTTPVADALRMAPAGEVALVVLPRKSVDPSWSSGDVVGSIRYDGLRQLGENAAGDPISLHMAGALPTVGAGEAVVDALKRVEKTHEWVAVLLDGRVTAVVRRSAIQR